MQKILVVEDEEDLLAGLEHNLAQQGYAVLKARRGEEVVGLVLKESPSLVILDLMLPGKSGLDVCKELRQKEIDTPVIMLTAKSEEVDRVVGLEIGADDYVTKPFSLPELMARVRVQLRRVERDGPRESVRRYRFGDVEVDFEKFQATRADHAVKLTTKEFDLLRMLIRHRGEVVTRDRLLNEVWGYDTYPTTRTVDNHILKLRQKLEPDPASPVFILSAYGAGYMFVG